MLTDINLRQYGILDLSDTLSFRFTRYFTALIPLSYFLPIKNTLELVYCPQVFPLKMNTSVLNVINSTTSSK